jgi:hypothetical protein
MSNPAKGISPSKGLYIKLGRSGIWEKECLENGILRFGYKETPFDAAVSGDWETVRKVWLDAGRTRGQRQGTLFRSVISLKQRRKRYGCFAKPGVKKHEDGKGSYSAMCCLTVGGAAWR